MPRRSVRDVSADRQRKLFGVDRLERHIADVTSEVLRLIPEPGRLGPHATRMAAWLEEYIDNQRSDFELGGQSDDAAKTK